MQFNIVFNTETVSASLYLKCRNERPHVHECEKNAFIHYLVTILYPDTLVMILLLKFP